jgi:nucleoside-diphosphate-sugar epimerase
MRVVVIGAGPCGLAAALAAVRRGHDVTVLERETVGASLRRWGNTRFFSPLGMNVPPSVRELVALPAADAILTGPAFVEEVLVPLAASAPLAGRVHVGHSVVSIGRARMSRGDMPDHPIRADRAFRLLVETPGGESELEADVVLDASGNRLPTWLGAGGTPARGERMSDRILYGLGALHARVDQLRGRRILLVGHGHSAANAIHVLATLDARVVWAVRSPNARPCVEVASDPLPERQRVVAEANGLASQPPPWLVVERRAHVVAIEPQQITLTGGRTVEADYVVAMTGWRPDPTLTSELALDVSPLTEGAGGIARRLANVTDCLAVPRLAASDLASGEPRFHFVGARSYGRARTFLLQTGYEQIETIVSAI